MQRIGRVPRVEFLAVAEEVMAHFVGLPGNPKPERTGGFMAVLHQSTDGQKMLFVNELGTCKADLAEGCFRYCQEKVIRLAAWQGSGHLSGWQSRDIENKKYGGAIAAPSDGQGLEDGRDLIGAVSGLVEHGDEAVTLVIWLVFRWITFSEAQKIAQISKNPFLELLMMKCSDLFCSAQIKYE